MKNTKTYDLAYRLGYEAHRDEIAANYDDWRRATRDNEGRSTVPLEDLAIRQVIYGNPLGKRPDEQTD